MVTRVLILRAPGTNCDEETARALREAGAEAHIVHTNKLLSNEVDLFHYHGLVLPGGFSYGDRVRAGAIWASKLKSKVRERLVQYALDGNPILGICNGFQALIELGLLPFTERPDLNPRAALAPNASPKFEARWVYLKCERGRCIFTRRVSGILRMPVAHSEGRFISDGKELIERGQVVLRYVKPDGTPANGEYPFNPNGSMFDIAGICNERGNVFGLMPHPERAVYGWQMPDHTSARRYSGYADGWHIFRSMVEYIEDEIK